MEKTENAGVRDGEQKGLGGGDIGFWLSEIEDARKREREFRVNGEKYQKLYESDSPHTPYNILYANTEILQTALYGASPRPVCNVRDGVNNPIAAASCKLVLAILEHLRRPNTPEAPSFDGLIEKAILQALVPGRGLISWQYVPTIARVEEVEMVEGADGVIGEEVRVSERLAEENILGEVIPYNAFLHGDADTWEKVPWIAFELNVRKEVVEKRWGREVAEELSFCDAAVPTEKLSEAPKNPQVQHTTRILHIWDKVNRKIIYIAEDLNDRVLEEVEDSLQLQGFFNCAPPLLLYPRLSGLVPKSPYEVYKDQAEELNVISDKIQKIVNALKIRGVYDARFSETLATVMKAGDLEMVAATSGSAIGSQETVDLNRAIWMWPLEKLVQVLQQMYQERREIKEVIYELIGLADIMRGSTAASESATAQKLKSSWGGLRLKKMQRRVAEYVSENFRVMVELAVQSYSIDTIAAIVGATEPQAKAEVAQVVEFLKQDQMRSLMLSIEADSNVNMEMQEDRQELQELLMGLAQFAQSYGPLVQAGVVPFQLLQAFLLTMTKKYRLGGQLEAVIAGMQQPQPQQEGQDGEAQAKQMEMQAKAGELQMQAELNRAKAEAQMQELQQNMMLMQAKMENMRMELQAEREMMGMKLEEARMKYQAAVRKAALDAQMPRTKSQPQGRK